MMSYVFLFLFLTNPLYDVLCLPIPLPDEPFVCRAENKIGAEGVQAIAEALKVNGVLTQLNLRGKLGALGS